MEGALSLSRSLIFTVMSFSSTAIYVLGVTSNIYLILTISVLRLFLSVMTQKDLARPNAITLPSCSTMAIVTLKILNVSPTILPITNAPNVLKDLS